MRGAFVTLVLTRGGLDMLEDFGFCEGGLDGSNRYRLDPAAVQALLSGVDSPEAAAVRQVRRAHKNGRRLAEREALLRDMEPRLHEPGAREFLEQQLGKLADK